MSFLATPNRSARSSLARSFVFDELEYGVDSPIPSYPRHRSVRVQSPGCDREGSVSPHNYSEAPSILRTATPAKPIPVSPRRSQRSEARDAGTPSARPGLGGEVTPYIAAHRGPRPEKPSPPPSPRRRAGSPPEATASHAVRLLRELPCDTPRPAEWKRSASRAVEVNSLPHRAADHHVARRAELEAEAEREASDFERSVAAPVVPKPRTRAPPKPRAAAKAAVAAPKRQLYNASDDELDTRVSRSRSRALPEEPTIVRRGARAGKAQRAPSPELVGGPQSQQQQQPSVAGPVRKKRRQESAVTFAEAADDIDFDAFDAPPRAPAPRTRRKAPPAAPARGVLAPIDLNAAQRAKPATNRSRSRRVSESLAPRFDDDVVPHGGDPMLAFFQAAFPTALVAAPRAVSTGRDMHLPQTIGRRRLV